MRILMPMNCGIYQLQFLVSAELRRKDRLLFSPIDTLWLQENHPVPPCGVHIALSDFFVDFSNAAASWPGCMWCGLQVNDNYNTIYWWCEDCAAAGRHMLNCGSIDYARRPRCPYGHRVKFYRVSHHRVPIVHSAIAPMQVTSLTVWRG
jgi:hypothetical protein